MNAPVRLMMLNCQKQQLASSRWLKDGRMAALEIESGFSGNVRPPRDRLQMIRNIP